MRVLLIHPLHEKLGGEPGQKKERLANKHREVCFPLGIGYVAAVLRADGHDVTAWDIHAENLLWEEVQSKLKGLQFDLVGISAISSQYEYVKRLAAFMKGVYSVPIVVGGALAIYSYRLLLERCAIDYCVLGEGEITAVDLLRNLTEPGKVKGIAYRDSQGQVQCTAPRMYMQDLGQLPMPAYELFDMDFYITHGKKMKSTRQNPLTGEEEEVASTRLGSLRTGYVIAGRGCPYKCRFCSRNFEGIRLRPLDHLMAEIQFLRDRYGVEFIHLGDELVTLNKTRTLELCEAMKRMGLPWDCQSRVNVVDEEMLAAMKDAGCVTIGFGIESGSQRLLDAMKKATTVAQIENAMRLAMKYDFDIKVQLMFGFPGEDSHSLQETIDLFKRLGHPGRGMSFYTVLPGTDIYDFSVRTGIIPDEDEYLCKLTRCVASRVVLLNFTDFPSHEIHPRIKWATRVMKANACQNKARREAMLAYADRGLPPLTIASLFRKLAFRFSSRRATRVIQEELTRMNSAGGTDAP